jgi:hypothetical protein
MVRFAGAATLVVLIGVTPAAAADPQTGPVASQSVAPAIAVRDVRPPALLPLYASFVGLQVLDFHSTADALSRGAVEGNPAMQGVTSNQLAFAAAKAAGTAGVIVLSEKIRKKNKAAAVGLMIATNSAMAWVVQHNYRAAH